jgi:hypothetical protein
VRKRKQKTTKKTGPCSLCSGQYDNYGNNPEPLRKFEERCCSDCNIHFVLPMRILRLQQPDLYIRLVWESCTK